MHHLSSHYMLKINKLIECPIHSLYILTNMDNRLSTLDDRDNFLGPEFIQENRRISTIEIRYLSI